jgi:hypothetical protein
MNILGSSCKVPNMSPNFNQIWSFSTDFCKYQISRKSMWADRQTDRQTGRQAGRQADRQDEASRCLSLFTQMHLKMYTSSCEYIFPLTNSVFFYAYANGCLCHHTLGSSVLSQEGTVPLLLSILHLPTVLCCVQAHTQNFCLGRGCWPWGYI